MCNEIFLNYILIAGTQVKIASTSKTTQTDTSSTIDTVGEMPKPEPSDSDIPSSSPTVPEEDDEDYIPSTSSEESTSETGAPGASSSTTYDNEEKFYIVSWASLLVLLRLISCAKCSEQGLTMSQSTRGTLLQVVLTCPSCHYENKWNSQSFTGNVPTGNLLLSAAIITSGAIATQVLRVFQHMKVVTISVRTFFRHQRMYLLPAIQNVWAHTQTWLIASLQAEQRGLIIGGDGRMDSPGHSAKYGSYTVLELQANAIIDTQLIQVCIIFHWNIFKLFNILVTRHIIHVNIYKIDKHHLLVRQNLLEYCQYNCFNNFSEQWSWKCDSYGKRGFHTVFSISRRWRLGHRQDCDRSTCTDSTMDEG